MTIDIFTMSPVSLAATLYTQVARFKFTKPMTEEFGPSGILGTQAYTHTNLY